MSYTATFVYLLLDFAIDGYGYGMIVWMKKFHMHLVLIITVIWSFTQNKWNKERCVSVLQAPKWKMIVAAEPGSEEPDPGEMFIGDFCPFCHFNTTKLVHNISW